MFGKLKTGSKEQTLGSIPS